MEIFYSESGKYYVADPMKIKSFLKQSGRELEKLELNLSKPLVSNIITFVKYFAFLIKNSIGFIGYVQIGCIVAFKGLLTTIK